MTLETFYKPTAPDRPVVIGWTPSSTRPPLESVEATERLAGAGSAAVGPLFEVFRKSPRPEVRQAAFVSLLAIGRERLHAYAQSEEVAVACALEAAEESAYPCDWAGAQILRRVLAGESAARALRLMFQDIRESRRAAAFDLLELLCHREDRLSPELWTSLHRLLLSLMRHWHFRVRSRARELIRDVEATRIARGERLTQAVSAPLLPESLSLEQLLGVMRTGGFGARLEAAWRLGEHGSEATGPLVHTLRHDADDGVRIMAAAALYRQGDSLDRSLLQELSTSKPAEAWALYAALGREDARDADFTPLAELIDSGAPSQRLNAVRAVGLLMSTERGRGADREPLQAVLLQALKHPIAEVRTAAIEAIRTSGDRTHVPQLIALLKENVRVTLTWQPALLGVPVLALMVSFFSSPELFMGLAWVITPLLAVGFFLLARVSDWWQNDHREVRLQIIRSLYALASDHPETLREALPALRKLRSPGWLDEQEVASRARALATRIETRRTHTYPIPAASTAPSPVDLPIAAGCSRAEGLDLRLDPDPVALFGPGTC